MRKFLTVVFVLTAFTLSLEANNLQVSKISIVNQVTSVNPSYSSIQFDLNWENSFFVNSSPTAPDFWDAAYVFVKFRVNSGPWTHAFLSTNSNDHSVVTNNSVTPAFDVATTQISSQTKGVGVFIHKTLSNPGNSDINWDQVQLKWNYGDNGVQDDDLVEVKVFAIEMVYIPEGQYYLGDGTSTDHFYKYPNSGTSFFVENAGPLNLGETTDYLNSDNNDFPTSSTLPAAYPNGYGSYYVMKYEITNGQYRDFLNTLDYDQQDTRTFSVPESPAGTYAIRKGTDFLARQNIVIKTAGVDNTDPAIYGCDLNGNGTCDEDDDGEYIATNFLIWEDLLAYADWSGLRPMTELEYEKANRGVSIGAVTGEYAWGSPNYYNGEYTLTGARDSTEQVNENLATSTLGNLNYRTNTPASPNTGCLRVGIFAKNNSVSGDRILAGAGFYGVMEMSGNVWEMTVPITKTTFTGLPGDGTLNSAGDAHTIALLWPPSGGVRGGNFGNNGGTAADDLALCRISDRKFALFIDNGTRYNTVGGRLARTAN